MGNKDVNNLMVLMLSRQLEWSFVRP